MIRNIKCVFVSVLVSFILVRCASVSSPTGGPQDTIPPRFIASTTENFATNFNASSIILTFNEFVRLNNPSQNIITSPPLGTGVAFTAVKNKIFITFKEDLEPDLTYHINFGNSIQDVNENNPLNNFQFIFSTGDKIDSLGFNGRLSVVNETEITEKTLVGLYRNLEDSAFLKEAPFYFTYVGSDGNFNLRNLKNGTYTVRALADANGNRFYDLPNESIGFLQEPIELDSNIFNVDILFFNPEQPNIRVVEFTNNITNYTTSYNLSRPLSTRDSLSYTFLLNDSVSVQPFVELDEERKVITAFFDSTIQNGNQIKAILEVNSILIDTFQHTASSLKKETQNINLENTFLLNLDTLKIKFSVPLVSHCEKITIIDTVKSDTMLFSAVKAVENQLDINLNQRLKAKNVYTLLIQDSCVFDVLGQANEIYRENFTIQDIEDRGWLKMTFEDVDSSKNYLVKFVDAQKKILAFKNINHEGQEWVLPQLIPGSYYLKIVEDENDDAIWNSGNYSEMKFPEKIYELPKEIVIRPNWELEETIKLSGNNERKFRPEKKQATD